MSKYWKDIKTAAKTLNEGLKVTMKHMKDARGSREALYADDDNYFERENGLFTTQYPKETLPVPDHGRYKLHNEIDDCIVCDKCAKVCPVNCIDIEPIRSVGEIGKTSDGTSKRIYAAKFDIDMAKCCFCGLCTTVCPTECLTMTDEYDFSTYDIAEHNFEFGEMTPLEILEKRKELEEFNKQKEAQKAARPAASGTARPQVQPRAAGGGTSASATAKPVFKPKVPVPKPPAKDGTPAKPVIRPKVPVQKKEGEEAPKAQSRPVVKPKAPVKPNVPGVGNPDEPAPPPRPTVPMLRRVTVVKKDELLEETKSAQPKPVRPKVPMKPKIPTAQKEGTAGESTENKPKVPKPKVPMRPKIPTRKPNDEDQHSPESDA